MALQHRFTRAFRALAMMLGLGACDRGPVTIGITLGTGESNAARFAIADAAQAGLMTGIDTVFIYAGDTRAAPALQAAEQMMREPRLIGIVGHNNSAASLATAPIYNRHQIVQLSPNATAVLYSQAGPFSFRLVSSDDRQGRFLGERLLERAAGRRVALMYVNDDYGRGLRREVMRAIPPGAVEWVLDAPHNEGATDLSSRVTIVSDAHPEAIVWLGRGLELEKMLPGIRERLGDVFIIGGDAIATVAMCSTDDRWAGVWFVDLLDLDGSDEMRAMRQRYAERYGNLATAGEILAYDAMSLMIAAVRSGARTGSEVQTFMNELGRKRPAFNGISGPIQFDENGDVARDYILSTRGPAL